jgi:hypothetical protein
LIYKTEIVAIGIWERGVPTGRKPVLAQTKVCGYMFTGSDLLIIAKILPDTFNRENVTPPPPAASLYHEKDFL